MGKRRVPKNLIKIKADQRAVDEGCYFDQAAADRVIQFFERYLYHVQGEWAGKPFILLPWQRDDVITPLYGWKRADGSRRFRYAYISVAKSNGKSPLLAGLILYSLTADGEYAAKIISAGVDRDQARIVYD